MDLAAFVFGQRSNKESCFHALYHTTLSLTFRAFALGSVVFSMTSFHGRGFFPGGITLDDPLTVLAAFEAFVGLLIEVTFIATLTQRLFGK